MKASVVASPKAMTAKEPAAAPEKPAQTIERNKFEDEFPVMFQFYLERSRLNEVQLQKVQDIQSRWKSGLVYWLTHDNQEVAIPEWVAVNVVVNNKLNLAKGSRICMSLNHTKGYGCNRNNDGLCSYVHECCMCGQVDHGVFQRRANGTWICAKLRKWYDEEERYKAGGFGDPRQHEDLLSDIAKKPRVIKRASASPQSTVSAWASPLSCVASSSPTTATTTPTATPSASGHGGPSATPSPSSLELPEAATAAGSPQAAKGGSGSSAADADDDARTRAGSSQQSFSTCSSQRSPDLGASSPPPRPPKQPPPPPVPKDWQALWSEDYQSYYYWHVPTNSTTWEAPAAETAEAAGHQATNGNSLAAAAGAESAREEAARGAGGGAAADSGRKPMREVKVCSQHWRPQPGAESCLRVFKGERLIVTWTDGSDAGWAYGHVAEDPHQIGYFPQAVLLEPRRPGRKRPVGQVCPVLEAFDAPEEVGGYLTVRPGDLLRVLHPTEVANAWVYAETQPPPGEKSQIGWVPEAILQDPGGNAHENEGGGSRATA